MSSGLTVRRQSSEIQVELVSLSAEDKELILGAKSENTLKAYRSDWKQFQEWAEWKGFSALPAEPNALVKYLRHLSPHAKVSTIRRSLSSISEAHKTAGFESPTKAKVVQNAMQAIKRSKGVAQDGKAPLLTEAVRTMVRQCPSDKPIGVRDKAILLLGFAGAFRRSELAALSIEDLTRSSKGYEVLVRRSKTDQDGAGHIKAIAYGADEESCPVRSLDKWIELARIKTGPLFLQMTKAGEPMRKGIGDKLIERTVKRYALAAGLDPAEYAGHSLRAGFATQAALNGASDRGIMNQTGHKSRAMVDRYVRRATVWQDNAALKLGL
jgi:site-specific recombinase XerD